MYWQERCLWGEVLLIRERLLGLVQRVWQACCCVLWLVQKVVDPQISVLDPSSMPLPPTTKLMSKKTDKSTTLVYLQREGKDDLPLFTTTANTVYVYNNEVNLYHVNDQFMKTAELIMAFRDLKKP